MSEMLTCCMTSIQSVIAADVILTWSLLSERICIHKLTDKADLGSGSIGLLVNFLWCEASYLAIRLVFLLKRLALLLWVWVNLTCDRW